MSPRIPFPVLILLCGACASAQRDLVPARGVELEPLVSVELALIEAPRAQIDRLLDAGAQEGAVHPPGFRAEIDALVRGRTDMQFSSRPRLLLLPGARGEMSISSEESYVQDFEVDAAKGIADPVIATIREGVWFEVRPSIADDGESIELDFSLVRSAIRRPIREEETTIPNTTAKVTIHLPVCETRRVKTRVTLRPGESWVHVMNGEDGPDASGRAVLAVLTAELRGRAATADRAAATITRR